MHAGDPGSRPVTSTKIIRGLVQIVHQLGSLKIRISPIPVLCLVYLVLTFLLPYRRVLIDVGESSPLLPLAQFALFTPMFLIVGLLLMKGRDLSPITPMFSPTLGVGILVFLVLTVPLAIFKIPGPISTWTSLGMYASGILLILWTRRDLHPVYALGLGLGLAAFVAGTWEGVFTVMYSYVYMKGVEDYLVVSSVLPVLLIVGGLVIPIFRVYGGIKPHFGLGPVILLAVTVVLWIIWWKMGLWADIYWDRTTDQYTYLPDFDYVQMVIYKASKVTWLLGWVGLYLGRTGNAISR